MKNGYWVSTVWIGLVPVGFVGRRPPIFQTKVFYAGTVTETAEYRYPSEKLALIGHVSAIKAWEKKPKAKRPKYATLYPGTLGYPKRASVKRKKGKTHASRKA